MEQPNPGGSQTINLNSQNVYEITVRGEIDKSWLAGDSQVNAQTEIIAQGGHQSTRFKTTRFKIVRDQAGLVGLIRRLHGLGVVLVAVRQAAEADDPP